jgi:DNA polymerase III subunit epsilon
MSSAPRPRAEPAPLSLGAFGVGELSVLAEIPFVAFDTETTGLHATDRLVELAAVRFRAGLVEAEWSTLVNPGGPIPPEAVAVHGISDAAVANAAPAREVLPKFLGFIEGAALVAHNAPFDIRVMALELLRAGLPLPDNPVLDTCALSRRLGIEVPNHRLGTLAQALGVPQGRAHRALTDARVAKDLLQAYFRELGGTAEALVRHALTSEPLLLSFRGLACEPVPATPLVSLMRRARAERRAVAMACVEGGRSRTWRVEPRDIYALGSSVYVEADCHEDGAVRTFRADNILAARLDSPGYRPM